MISSMHSLKLESEKRLFQTIFTILLLLFFLLGETYWRYLSVGGTLVFFWIFRSKNDLGAVDTEIGKFWKLFILILTILLPFSVHIPLSIFHYIFYTFSFLFFIWFYTLDKKFFSLKQFLITFYLISSVLILLATFFFFFPEFAIHLPGMNPIFSTYGHNHIVALLILLYPLSWYSVLRRKKTAYLLIPIFLLILAIVSFGRLGVGIIIIQTLYFFWIFRSKIKINKFFIFLFSTMLITGIAGILVSSLTVANTEKCNFSMFNKNLCKPVIFESRPLYYRQAFRILLDYPFTGSGGGTFGVVSRRYQQFPSAYSNFVHNIFLQQFAELGIFGGLAFTVLMVTLIVTCFKVVRKLPNESIFHFMFISIVGSYLNAFLDFDWSFLGLFLVTMIFIIIILREKVNYEELNINVRKKSNFSKEFGLYGILLALISISYVFAEVLIFFHKEQLVMKYVPFFYVHKNIVLNDEQIAISKTFHWLYRNDIGYLTFEMERTKSLQEKIELRNKIFSLYPWDVKNGEILIEEYEKIGLKESAEEVLFSYVNFISDASSRYNYFFPYEEKKWLLSKIFTYADDSFQSGEYQKSGKFYLLAHKLDMWALATHAPIFHGSNTKAEALNLMLAPLDSVAPNQFGQFREKYAEAYSVIMILKLEQNDFTNATLFLEKINELVDWYPSYLWSKVSRNIVDSVEENVEERNMDLAREQVFWLRNYYNYLGGKDKLFIDSLDSTKKFFEFEELLIREK